MSARAQVREFVENLLRDKSDVQPFTDSDSLIFSGRLQSIDAVEIVVFLEEGFGIDFAEIGFDEQMLDSVNAICALIGTSGKLPIAI